MTTLVHPRDLVKTETYAPIAMFAPKIIMPVNYEVFRQSKSDKDKAFTAKTNHRDLLRKHYGTAWKRFLNIPDKTIGEPIRFQS